MKRIFLSLAAVCCCALAQAQILFTDVNPDAQVATWDAYQAHFLNNTAANAVTIWFHPWHPNEVVVNAPATIEVMMSANGMPAFSNDGDSITASQSWKTVSYDTLNFNGTSGNWITDAEGYLGIRFKNNGQWNYGWIKLYVDQEPNGFIVEEYACNSVSGAGLKAGQSSLGVEAARVSAAQIFCEERMIRIRNASADQAILSDMSGKVMAATGVTGNSAAIDASSMPAGIYLVRLIKEGRLIAAQKIGLR